MHVYYFLTVYFSTSSQERLGTICPKTLGPKGLKKCFKMCQFDGNTLPVAMKLIKWNTNIERFPSRHQYLCYIGTKESIYMRKEFNSHRIFLEHQYGRRDVIRKTLYKRGAPRDPALAYFTTVASLLPKALPWRKRRLLFNNSTHS